MPAGAAAQRMPAPGAEASQPAAVARTVSSADLLPSGTLLLTLGAPPQRRQQQQVAGNPLPPPPLPPRPPASLLQVPPESALIPSASPSWPPSPAANAPPAPAAAATATGVDLLSSWNPPAAFPAMNPQASRGAVASAEDAASTASAAGEASAASPRRETTPASSTAAAAMESAVGSTTRVPAATPQPPRPPPPHLTAAAQAIEAAAAEFAATSPGVPQPDRRAAVEAAAAGFAAATRDGRESAEHRSHGRLDATSAALAAVRSPTGARAAPTEDALTAEEAQAIIDAADMAAAEAVVAAAEAAEAVVAAAEVAEAGVIAALADLQSPTDAARAPVADTATPQPSWAPPRQDAAVQHTLREVAAAGAGSTPLFSMLSRAGGPTAAALSDAAAATGPVAVGRTDEEEEIAAAVAAVAELEARDRLHSSAGGAGGRGVPVVRGTPGDEGVAVTGTSRCTLCRSSVERVVPAQGNSSNSSNCRNCWRPVCDDCVGTFWARSMVPPRYTLDSDVYRMRICKTCDAATEAFREALLRGKAEEAMSAYSTGCVNLDRPYTIYHGELPVHCAAAGGNVGLLSWLVDELGCCLFADSHKKEPVRDLRRLTVLGAAAVNGQVQAMRYLVNQKGCCVSELTHIPTLKSALDACLHGSAKTRDGERSRYKADNSPGSPANAAGVSTSSGAATSVAAGAPAADEDDDCCIVCFDSAVDCTLVPCGHHCCCVECASKFNICPVCRTPVNQKIKAISV